MSSDKQKKKLKIGFAGDILFAFLMVKEGIMNISDVDIGDIKMAMSAVSYALNYGTSIDRVNFITIKADDGAADVDIVPAQKEKVHNEGFMDITHPLHCDLPPEGETNNEIL